MTTPASFAPPTIPEYVLHLWKRSWMIGGIGVLAGAGAWLAASRPASITYSATAEILVRPRPVAPESGRGAEPVPTPAFESLFVADETLEAVRLAYNESAGQAPFDGGPASIRALIDTSVRTTVDTTVYTQFSPVISLDVTTADATRTRALLDAWTSVVMSRYGNLLEDEAAAAQRRLSARAEELAAKRRELLVEHYGTQASLLMREAEVARQHRALHGYEVAPPSRVTLGLGGASTTVVVPPTAPRPDGSGWVPARETVVPPAEDNPSTKAAREQLLANMDDEIRRGGDRLAELMTQAATTAGDLGTLEVRLAAVDAQLASVFEALRAPTLAGGVADADGGGTLRLVSRGLEPVAVSSGANRLLPLLAAIAAMAGAVVLLLAELYLRRALASASK